MHRLGIVVFMVVVVGAAAVGTQGSPLAQFRGQYRVNQGPVGTVRVADALGASYTEWTVSVGQPSHELRMLVGPRRADNTFPVWRFEQEPAPNVVQEGTGRLSGQEFVADFPSRDGEPGKFIRERWTLRDGRLQFDLEASGEGVGPRRVGGFIAVRE